MNLRQQREVARLKSAAQFANDHTAIFVPKSPKSGPSTGQQIMVELNALIIQTGTVRVAQVGSAKIASTGEKSVLREALQSALSGLKSSISYIAAERKTPALAARFPLPHGTNDEELIAHASSFYEAIKELNLEPSLLALDHAPDFLEALRRTISEFGNANARQSNAIQEKAGATASIEPTLARARVLLRGLDAIIKNKFKDDPEKLGAWQSAMHLERPKRASKKPEPASVIVPALPAPTA